MRTLLRIWGSTRLVLAALIAAALVGALMVPSLAHASASGFNGRIAWLQTSAGVGSAYSIAPDGSDLQQDGVNNAINGFSTQSGAISPDGTKAAVENSYSGTPGLGIVDLSTGTIGPNLSPGIPVSQTGQQISWSPDGTKIAYIGTATKTNPGDEMSSLLVVPADGSTAPQVLVPGQATGTTDIVQGDAFTGDGSEIVFVHLHNEVTVSGTQEWRAIQAIRPDGTGLRSITPAVLAAPPAPRIYGIDVAGDNSQVAFVTQTPAGGGFNEQLEAVPLAGGTPVGLVQWSVPSQSPTILNQVDFSPDGKLVAYEHLFADPMLGGRTELRTVKADGSGGDQRLFYDPTRTPQAMNWLAASTPVIVDSGPDGLTNQRRPAFSFIAISPPPGHYECRIDHDDFATCTSPFSPSAALIDGAHTFAVRYVPDGKSAGTPSSRAFTVDATPPTAIVDSAPPATGAPSDVTITFHSSEPDGATFECSLDGLSRSGCSSPVTLTGLNPAHYHFEIFAIDKAGNEQGNATSVDWTVSKAGPGAVPANCPAGSAGKVAFGPIVAIAPTLDACFHLEPISGRNVEVARGAIFVNGLRVVPKPGVGIIVDGVAGNGTVRSTGPVTIGVGPGFQFEQNPLQLNALAGGAVIKVTTKLNDILSKLGGLKLFAAPTLEFSADNGGQTKVGLTVALPELFTALPAAAPAAAGEKVNGGLTADLGAVASNNLGVFYTGKAKISDLWLFGKVGLKDLTLGFDQSLGTFEGSVGLSLAKGAVQVGTGSSSVLTASLSIGPDGVIGPIRKFSLAGSDLQIPVGDGFFLQRLAGTIDRGIDQGEDVAIFSITGGLSVGKRFDVVVGGNKVFKTEVISVDGAGSLLVPIFASQRQFVISLSGTGKAVDIPILNETMTYRQPGGLDVTGSLDYTIGGYGFRAAINHAWFDPPNKDFNIEASGSATYPLLGADTADVVVSKTGYAACFALVDLKAGFSQMWGGSLQLWGDSCDVGPFRRGPKAADVASAAARRVTISRGEPLAVIQVTGTGGPPQVSFHPPHGPAIAAAAGRSTRVPHGLIAEDPVRNTTTLLIAHPAAGSWRIEPAAGVRLKSVSVADGLPRVRVHVRVAGRGANRTLRWRTSGLAGQQLTLVEEGKAKTAHRLIETKRPTGTLRFAPSAAVSGAVRHIEAFVVRHRLVRVHQIVASYRFVSRAPGRTTKVRRKGSVLSWKAVPGATSYDIALRVGAKRVIQASSRRPRLTLPAAARHGRLTVEIVALDAAGRVGPTAVAQLT